jgi:hypothetical protein
VSLCGDNSADAITINAPIDTFEGFSIKQKINKWRAAVTVVSASVSFTNCKVRAVTLILIKDEGSVELSKSVVKARVCPALNLIGHGRVVASDWIFQNGRR